MDSPPPYSDEYNDVYIYTPIVCRLLCNHEITFLQYSQLPPAIKWLCRRNKEMYHLGEYISDNAMMQLGLFRVVDACTDLLNSHPHHYSSSPPADLSSYYRRCDDKKYRPRQLSQQDRAEISRINKLAHARIQEFLTAETCCCLM